MDELKQKITDYVMSEKFQDKRGLINEIDMADDIVQILYDISSDLGLEVSFTGCDSSSDYRIEATVYVKNLLGESKGYNVIIDIDFDRQFDNREECIEAIYYAELHAQNVLSHFKK